MSISIITHCMYVLHTSLTLRLMSTINSPVSSRLLHVISLQYWLFFHRIFTWISLGDFDLCFPLMLERKADAVKEETTWAVWLHHQCNQSIHIRDGMSVASLSANLPQRTSVATDHPWQITLNRRLSRKLKNWRKFSIGIKAISRNK
jgi:hypothetical protein